MEVQEYFNRKKEFYNILLEFIEEYDSNDESNDANFKALIQYIEIHKFNENTEEFEHFLRLLLNIFNNHYRHSGFISKIERIFLYFEKSIKQTFLNIKIFEIFKDCRYLLLFIISKHIINLDKDIINRIVENQDIISPRYCHFFLPEIKESNDLKNAEIIENEIMSIDQNFLKNYEENRQIGENDSYICTLIRQDSIEEFVSYVNKLNINLSSHIKMSIFETNSFLIENKPTLIEYAAFYGSIQIIQFLKYSNVNLTENLWLYAIHSNNAELIHILEDYQLVNNDIFYETCFLEAIKCHHNNIANYIFDNLLTQQSMNEKIINCSFRYCNYSFTPSDFDKNFAFFYLCKYKYLNIVDILIENKKEELNNELTVFFNNYCYQISIQLLFLI